MHSYLLLVCVLLPISFGGITESYISEGIPLDHHEGAFLTTDSQGAPLKVTYDLHILSEPLIKNLDGEPTVKTVECDMEQISMEIGFSSKSAAAKFYVDISNNFNSTFITGGIKWNCNGGTGNPSVIIRRVLDGYVTGDKVNLTTTSGHYQQIIKQGDMVIQSDSHLSGIKPGHDPLGFENLICIGFNVDGQCNDNAQPFDIYRNKYISLTCEDCYLGARAYFYMELKFGFFKLKKIGAGFKRINAKAGLEFGFSASGSWSMNMDKTWEIVKHATLVDLMIGPVPINVWFSIPIQVVANSDFLAEAEARIGAKGEWDIGDAYIEWTEEAGWASVQPTPKFTWTPTVEGEASFHASADVALIPSIVVHAEYLLTTTYLVDPTLYIQAHGDLNNKQLCADMQYEVKSQVEADFGINIPFTRIHFDKQFGPKTLFDTGKQEIGHWCVGDKGKEEVDILDLDIFPVLE